MDDRAKPNYYEILQLQPYANPALVVAAYRILSKLYHPDTARSEANLEKFRLIQEAYETLSDAHKRKEYDSELRFHTPGGFGGGFQPEPEESNWEDQPSAPAPDFATSTADPGAYEDPYQDQQNQSRYRTLMLLGLYLG